MPHFHLIGRWLHGQVDCRWVDTSFHPDELVLGLIEESWKEALARPGVHLFDGPMCRLEGFSADAGRLELKLSRTSYKEFMGTNLRHADLAKQRGWGMLANPVGISCALVSADGMLMLGRRNQRVAYYPGRVHPFAGTLEPATNIDIFREAGRELAEELSLGEGDLGEMVCLGMAEDRSIRQPEVICLVHAKRGREEIERQLDDGEHAGVWHLSPHMAAVEVALRDTRLLTPIGAATILLWGKEHFGQEWFEEASTHWLV